MKKAMKEGTVRDDNVTVSDEDTNDKDIPVGMDTARKPVKRPWRERIRLFCYNPEEGSFLGRTPLSWVQIILFYICFFAGLLLFWLICWYIFKATSPHWSKGPRWQAEKSIIGTNPGNI